MLPSSVLGTVLLLLTSFLIMLCSLGCWGPAAVITVSSVIFEREETERKAGSLDIHSKSQTWTGGRQNCHL